MLLKGYCENCIGISLAVSQEGNLKSDRLENSISVFVRLCIIAFTLYKLGIYFSRISTYREIPRKLDDAKIFHFTV